MKVEVGARSDIGRLRKRNEDAYLLKDGLFIVADGMGGHRGGDVASNLALETIGAGTATEATLESLVDEIKKAHQTLLERGESDRDLRGMGTTITAIIVEDSKAHVAHVGDSRAYLLRDGSIQQLTEDHTLVQRMVREGRLSEDEAARHPQRSVLTRALGVDEEISVDELTLDIHPGDRLLVCSDGLTSMVERNRIQKILEREKDPQAAADKLIDAANKAGGDDNITVIVVDLLEDDAAATTAISSDASRGSVDGESPDGTRAGAVGSTEDADSATQAVPVGGEDGAVDRSSRRSKIRWRRVAVWAGILVVVIAAGVIGARAYISHQWYVGDSEGRVAIYNGIPTTVVGLELSKVKETTNLDARAAERLQPWSGLKDGITAKSLADARTIVAQIRRDLQPESSG